MGGGGMGNMGGNGMGNNANMMPMGANNMGGGMGGGKENQ